MMSMLLSAMWFLKGTGCYPVLDYINDGCEWVLVDMKVWRARPETWRLGEKVAHEALLLQARTAIGFHHTHPQTYKPRFLCYHFPFITISFSRYRNTTNTVRNLNPSARSHSRATAVSPTPTRSSHTATALTSLPRRTHILRSFLICDTMLINPQNQPTSPKMVQDQGLNVYLAPARDFNKPYPQLVPREGTSSFITDPNEVYIEAVDDERFVVIIDLLKDFDFKGAKDLRFLCELDDSQGTTGCAGLGDLEDFESRVPEGSSLMGRHLFTEMTRKVDGTWSDCAITFGRLETGNDTHFDQCLTTSANHPTDKEMRLSNAETAYAVETYGRVVLTVWRGNRKNVRSALWKGYNPPDIETSSAEVVLDNGVSHAIK